MVRGVVREEEGNVFLLLEEVGDEQPSQIRTGALRDGQCLLPSFTESFTRKANFSTPFSCDRGAGPC